MDFHQLRHQTEVFSTLKKSIGECEIHCIYGQPQVGKTTIVRKFFDDNPEFVHVYMNCDDILSPSDLYIKIIKDLNRQLVKSEGKKKMPNKMIGIEEFIDCITEYLSVIANSKCYTKKQFKIFVTLDNLDSWKKTFIQDCIVALVDINLLGLVLISDQSIFDLTDHLKSTSTRAQIQDKTWNIQVLPWEKSDIIDVILRCQPKKHKALYETFVKLAVSLIYKNRTRNFIAIRNYCQLHFQDFIEYFEGKMHEKDSGLREKVRNMDCEEQDKYYLARFRPKVQMLVSQFVEPPNTESKTKSSSDTQNESQWLLRDQEIALNMGVLITTVYVAAYTSPSDDKKNFVPYQYKKFKGRRTTIALEEEEAASKTFTLERVIQIYRILLERSEPSKDPADQDENSDGANAGAADQVYSPDSMLSDLQFLEELKMIRIYNGDGLNSLTRYKIGGHITREYVERIAKQVGLSLDTIYGLS